MTEIKFSKEQNELIIRKLQVYFDEELDQDLGQFEAEFLLDFFTDEIGAYYYNQGLRDARKVMESKLEAIADTLYEIEKPTQA